MLDDKLITIEDPKEIYGFTDLLYKEEVYEIIACCLEVHKNLGRGFLEVVYKDALSIELENKSIPFEREKKFQINYKGTVLPHSYYCDFIIDDKIILEVKAQEGMVGAHYKQLINYLAISKSKLGLLINFGEESLRFKRVIL
jgi:GxxExxY protein